MTRLEIDALTGKKFMRELTVDEIAEREAMALEQANREVQALAREELRQSAINKLVTGQPLTEAEAELLVIK